MLDPDALFRAVKARYLASQSSYPFPERSLRMSLVPPHLPDVSDESALPPPPVACEVCTPPRRVGDFCPVHAHAVRMLDLVRRLAYPSSPGTLYQDFGPRARALLQSIETQRAILDTLEPDSP
jgi:hypothetical protein